MPTTGSLPANFKFAMPLLIAALVLGIQSQANAQSQNRPQDSIPQTFTKNRTNNAAGRKSTNAKGRSRAERSKALSKFFDRFDSNRDGLLTRDEVPERLLRRVAKMDRNSDGGVTRLEVVSTLRKQNKSQTDKRTNKKNRLAGADKGKPGKGKAGKNDSVGMTPQLLLAKFDKDRDNTISEQEAPKRFSRMFPSTDADGDGKLSNSELTSLVERIKARDQSKKRYDSSSELSKGQLPKRPPRSDD